MLLQARQELFNMRNELEYEKSDRIVLETKINEVKQIP